MASQFDRAAEDLGNIVALEHVNVQVEDQRPATLYYMSALGLTRDPYMMTSTDNMWANVGRSQFHLPTGKPQVLRGRVGLVTPDRGQLLQRLERMSKPLAGTAFAFKEHNDYVETTCPWGNTIRCHDPMERMELGMAYVEFDVPTGTAKGIAEFYAGIFDTMTSVKDGAAHISVGQDQELIFRETGEKLPAYDGHHIQVYVANFSKPHDRLLERGLVSEESNRYQYRFQDITDLKTGKKLFEIEHEIRSMTHPMFARPLINRNPQQTNRSYVPGRDGWTPAAIAEDMPGRPGRPGRQRMG
jgi:catechol-2,3-dioxygenase